MTPLEVGRLVAVRILLITSLVVTAFAHPLQQPDDSARLDRLTSLARLWSTVKFFHPYLVYRDDIDWDGTLLKAIPKVNAARNGKEYAAAVEEMLQTLGDPATRILATPAATSTTTATAAPNTQPEQFTRLTPDGVLVISLTHYSTDGWEIIEKLNAVVQELPKARAIVFDLRPVAKPTEDELFWTNYTIPQSELPDALTAAPLSIPAQRFRMHEGYAPQSGPNHGNYSSGFALQGFQQIMPAKGSADVPVVFIVDSNAILPDVALALQAAGKGAIVAEGAISDETTVATQKMDLADGVEVQIRLSELAYEDGTSGLVANLTVPHPASRGAEDVALKSAIELAKSGKFSPPPRKKLSLRVAALRDNPYDEPAYPSSELRVLAAFRMWAVIHYFSPYIDYIGEDWDGVLRKFIPRMEQSKNTEEYNLAVAEMATHIHDSHAFVVSSTLKQRTGTASMPIRIRMIDDTAVVTGFTDADAAKAAGVEIGDVVLKIDGEDVKKKLEEQMKFKSASTPQGAVYNASKLLPRGPEGSVAALTIRNLRGQTVELKIPRKKEYVFQLNHERSGNILRMLPGNIGYVDLDRLTVPQVDEMFEKFKNCSAIIFDNRGYPQDTVTEITPRLTDKSEPTGNLARYVFVMTPDDSKGRPSGQLFETYHERLSPHREIALSRTNGHVGGRAQRQPFRTYGPFFRSGEWNEIYRKRDARCGWRNHQHGASRRNFCFFLRTGSVARRRAPTSTAGTSARRRSAPNPCRNSRW